jgi:MFS family permease
VYTITAVPAGQWSDRAGRQPALTAGLLALALASLGTGLSTTVLPLVASFGVYGVANGLLEGNFRAYLSDLTPADSRGTALGLFHGLSGLAALAGGFTSGMLWDQLGVTAPFIWGAALCVATAFLLGRVANVRP